MDVAASSKGLRYSLGSRIFISGAQGGKRAVYTITAGTEGDSQVYKILVLRRLDLKNIRCYRSSDTDLTENLVPGILILQEKPENMRQLFLPLIQA